MVEKYVNVGACYFSKTAETSCASMRISYISLLAAIDNRKGHNFNKKMKNVETTRSSVRQCVKIKGIKSR